ncbi:tRNA (Adenine(22)-N(1))-methyltransferase, partial [Dysosmobacter welbionis]
LPQRVLGEVISRLRRPPKPQFRLLVVGKEAPTIPPALAQLVGGQGETSLPELLQHLHLLRFFLLWIFILLQHLLGALVGLSHLPVGIPGGVYRILILIYLVPHTGILEGKRTKPELLRLPDDHVLDGFELLLLGERQVFSGHVLVVTFQFIPKLVPLLIALCHLGDFGQFIHDGVYLRLYRLFQVAVDLFALVVLQHFRQGFHLLRNDRAMAQTCLHLPNEPPHGLHRRIPHLLIGHIF